MSHYLAMFTFKPGALGNLMKRPEDRLAMLGRLMQALEGHLQATCWLEGKYDGLALYEFATPPTEAELKQQTDTGLFRSIEWHHVTGGLDGWPGLPAPIPLRASSDYPPHARLKSVHFDDGHLNVVLEPGGERRVPYCDVVSLHGARLRRVSTNTRIERHLAPASLALGVVATVVSGVPIVAAPMSAKTVTTTKEEYQQVLGLRVQDVEELWFLVNPAFNFRDALGAEAGYVADVNLSTFVRKLVDACPESRRDGFVQAVYGGGAMPRPVDSLLRFMRMAQ